MRIVTKNGINNSHLTNIVFEMTINIPISLVRRFVNPHTHSEISGL